jgi:hypothetical protein
MQSFFFLNFDHNVLSHIEGSITNSLEQYPDSHDPTTEKCGKGLRFPTSTIILRAFGDSKT